MVTWKTFAYSFKTKLHAICIFCICQNEMWHNWAQWMMDNEASRETTKTNNTHTHSILTENYSEFHSYCNLSWDKSWLLIMNFSLDGWFSEYVECYWCFTLWQIASNNGVLSITALTKMCGVVVVVVKNSKRKSIIAYLHTLQCT